MASIAGNILSGVEKAATAVAKKAPDIIKKFTNIGSPHEFSDTPYALAHKKRQDGSE
jgi:hypothetical protein